MTTPWADTAKKLGVTSKRGLQHTALLGDPHIMTDGPPVMDFPTPTCTFILTDGTVIVADAPGPNQPLNDLHVFTDGHQHITFGVSGLDLDDEEGICT